MKYIPSAQNIPQDKRAEINDKILFLVEYDKLEQYNITKDEVFNSYTGDGGLHGLKYDDYESYYAYSQAKKEIDNGQYFTSPVIADFLMQCLRPGKEDTVMDLTGGAGVFANSMAAECNYYMNEIDIKAIKIAKCLYPEANITHGDIREYDPKVKADIIVGNPPFNLSWNYCGEKIQSQYFYCMKAHELLNPGGILALIVPNSFLNDEFMENSKIKKIEEHFSFLCQFDLPDACFFSTGVQNFNTKIILFYANSKHLESIPYKNIKEKITVCDEDAFYVHEAFLADHVEKKNKIKAKLFYESLHGDSRWETEKFLSTIKTYLFHIQTNPKTEKHYASCVQFIDDYKKQQQPYGMKYSEWEKVRKKPNDVIKFLKNALNSQNKPPERDVIDLVKSNNLIHWRARSDKTDEQLDKSQRTKSATINDMVYYDSYPFEDNRFRKLINKKRQAYENQMKPYDDVTPDADIMTFLKEFTIYDSLNEYEIKLNDRQLIDTAKILTKPYGILQWEQGSGKTITALAQHFYRVTHNNIFCSFVVSTAISIYNNWDVVLPFYSVDYMIVKKWEDVAKIKRGQLVLITLDILIKLQRYIKKFVKMQNKKLFLLFDESDYITSMDSQRAKAVKNCFRKLKYKTLLTGTLTRNNVNEYFSEYELLYNNSVNMLCLCDHVYVREKNQEELSREYNDKCGEPFPAYKKGYKLFQSCFLPEKITVFGVGQNTQDLYNSEYLDEILGYTVITKTLKEIAGKELYKIHQIMCRQNEPEKALYKIAAEKFYELEYLFNHNLSSRKAGMLRLINQLITLLKICAAPQTFKEYVSLEIPDRFVKVVEFLNTNQNQRIAIGVRHIDVVKEYEKVLREKYPDRPLFVVTGKSTSLKQRREVVKKMELIPDSILLCTQQSLSCAVNFDCIDTCLIPEIFWNNAAMSQYYFRFIRYNSTRFKNVYFLTNAYTIESNLLKMVMVKEKLNLYMKNQHLDDSMVEEKFGIDFNLLSMLSRKEYDEDGNVKVRWGEQKVS
jgi:hypothetical protein